MTVNDQTIRVASAVRDEMILTVSGAVDPITRAYADLAERTSNDLRRLLEAEALTLGAGQQLSFAQIRDRERLESILNQTVTRIEAINGQAAISTRSATTGEVMPLRGEGQAAMINSQLPEQFRGFGNQVSETTIQAVVERQAERLAYLSQAVTPEAAEAINRAVIDGVAIGQNPRQAAQTLRSRVVEQITISKVRAERIMRTEMMDAGRNADLLVRQDNADIVPRWEWFSAADERTCASCWALHGTTYPADVVGPDDHMNGRCVGLPVVRSSISLDLPPAPTRDELWARLSPAQQRQVLGPTRYEMLRSGTPWSAFTRKYPATDGWRSYHAATPIRELKAEAASIPPAPRGQAQSFLRGAEQYPREQIRELNFGQAEAMREGTEAGRARRAALAAQEQALEAGFRQRAFRVATDWRGDEVLEKARDRYVVPDKPALRTNAALRKSKGTKVSADTAAWDELVATSETATDVIFHRGAAMPREFVEGLTPGTRWTDHGFQSAALDDFLPKIYVDTRAATLAEEGVDGIERVLYRMRVPEGVKAVDLNGEWLLERGLTMEVAGVERVMIDGAPYVRVDLRVIGG